MGNEGSRGTTNGTAVVVQGPQQNGLNENDGNGTIHVDGEQVVEELNRNEPTIDPQPVIDKADEQNTDLNVNIQESGDQNDEKTVEITEKKKPKKRSFFSKEKVKLRDKKDKVKDIEKDIKIESIVEDNVKPEVVLPDVELVNGEHENQHDVTPPALPDKIGKENAEKPVTKKKDDKEEKKRLKEEKKRLKEEKEEKKRLKEEKKRSKSKKLKNEPEQDKKVQVEEIPVSTENFLCVCPGMEDIPQNSEHKEAPNDEKKDTTDLKNVVNENVEIVNEKIAETEKDLSSNVNKEIGKCTSAIPNGDNIVSEKIVGQIQDASEITNEKVGQVSKDSVGEHIKQNLDQSCPLPVIEIDKSPNSDQMTSKDSLTNLLMVEEDVITLEDADVKADADDVIVEGASCEDIDANKAPLPVISQSVPETVDKKISQETEVCITTAVESRNNADKENQESVKETIENPADNLCSVTDAVRETVSECKEVDIIVKESEALVQSKVEPESESIQSQVETEPESAKAENVQTNNGSNELVLSSVERDSNIDQVQLNENEPTSKKVENKEACHQSEKDEINPCEVATNEAVGSTEENKLESEEEKLSKSTEPTAESKLLDETNNNCSPTELTSDESKNDSVDEKVVSENDKIQLEFKADSVKVNTSLENDELKENPEDTKTTLDIKHDGQMESTTDDLKENSVIEKSVSETVTASVAETIAEQPNATQTDKTEDETLSLQSDFSVDTSPDSKNVTKDKKSKDKSKVKDKKKKDKSKGRSKVNSESSHDNVSVTSSSHSDKTDSPKSKNKKDKSKKKSSKLSDIHDNDSTTASECLSNTSDLDHSFSEIHKNDDGHCANDKKTVKETVSVDSHEKRKSGNIFSWNLLKSHKTEEEKEKKKKVKMRGVGKDMIQHPVNDPEETNKRRSIFDEEIHIELDDSHDIVSLSSLESDAEDSKEEKKPKSDSMFI